MDILQRYKWISYNVTPGNPQGYVAAAVLTLAEVIDSKFPEEATPTNK